MWLQGIGRIGAAGIVGLGVMAGNPAIADSPLWKFDPAANQLEMRLQDGAKPRYFLMAQPARIVVDVPTGSMGAAKPQETYQGAVRQVRASQYDTRTTRIVLELSPNVTLAPGQVKLQKAEAQDGKVRWVLRPLIVRDGTPPIAQTPNSASTLPPFPSIKPAPAAPTPVQATKPAPVVAAKPVEPVRPVAAQSSSADPAGGIAIVVPPPEAAPSASTAQALPVQPAVVPAPPTLATVSADSKPLPPATNRSGDAPDTPDAALPATVVVPTIEATVPVPSMPSLVEGMEPKATLPIAAAPVPAAKEAPSISPRSEATPELPGSFAMVSAAEPPASIQVPALETGSRVSVPMARSEILDFPTPQPASGLTPKPPRTATPSVSVPSLTPAPVEPIGSPEIPAAVSVPPLSPNPSPAVSVPPLPASSIAAPTAPLAPVAPMLPQPSNSAVVDFGQPLPSNPQPANSLTPQSNQGGLAAGTLLSLRYPGNAPLNLGTAGNRQEVLVLSSDIRDEYGNTLISAGTPIVGRFETTRLGSRFVAQAISVNGQSIPLSAQSEALPGNRAVSDNQLIQNSGIGAIAGGLVSDFSGWGVLGGAATGAAVTYLTAPKPAVIQPGQVIQVRLLQAL